MKGRVAGSLSAGRWKVRMAGSLPDGRWKVGKERSLPDGRWRVRMPGSCLVAGGRLGRLGQKEP